MNERKGALLSQIIKQYIKTASPVGSKLLEGKSKLGVSSATIRNEMAGLEQEGYITQPHTSAGRIPTEKGYQYYLENLVNNIELSSLEQKSLKCFLNKLKTFELETMIKQLARQIAEVSRNTIIVGFSSDNVYYTGIANLFSQPEFNNPECIYDIGLVVDHLDKVMSEIFDEINELEVRVGSKNPFSRSCSIVLTTWQFKRKKGIMGILGPMRMDYEKNLGLVKFINQHI